MKEVPQSVKVDKLYVAYQLKVDFDHLFKCFESPFTFLSLQFQYLNMKEN